MTGPDLLSQFRHAGIEQGGELFLPASTVVTFLESHDSLDVAVIGIEGFIISDHVVEPQLDLIGDCSDSGGNSWERLKVATRECASRVVRAARTRKNVYFTLELMSREDWAKMNG